MDPFVRFDKQSQSGCYKSCKSIPFRNDFNKGEEKMDKHVSAVETKL